MKVELQPKEQKLILNHVKEKIIEFDKEILIQSIVFVIEID